MSQTSGRSELGQHAGEGAGRLRISVIIPSRNGGETLPECLAALANSGRRVDEILLYDDGLNGDLQSLAKKYGATVISGGGVHVGCARGRNIAARHARGDVLLFTDADVVVAPDAIGRLVDVLGAEPKVAASFGSYDSTPRVTRLAALYCNLRHHYIHQLGDREASTFWTGLGAVRTELFHAMNGFDETMGIEDVELGVRLRGAGYSVRLVPDAHGKHLKDWRVGQLWRTDFIHRGLPWARMVARGGNDNAQLNRSHREKVSAVLAYATVGCLLGAFFAWWLAPVAAVLAGLYLYFNWGLLSLIYRRGGWRAFLAGAGLHMAYHLYAAAIFVVVLALEKGKMAIARLLPSRIDTAVAGPGLPHEEHTPN